ncbi:hypothetical protein F4604DRAFT_1797048 [Suillus subluteus]|nr:hypothetical protein F4604DRAFT_1797048 [Suillus subluteus]
MTLLTPNAMDSTAEDLASYLLQKLKLKAVEERLLVAIAGFAKVNALLAADSATHSTSAILFAKLLRQPAAAVITAPSFDHALKDPTPHAVSIYPSHRLVVIEGLYSMLKHDIWEQGAQLMDERWWIQVDLEEAKRRLVKRHVLTGVAKDMEEAIWRAGRMMSQFGLLDGKFIAENLYEPTRIIKSLDDPKYTL